MYNKYMNTHLILLLVLLISLVLQITAVSTDYWALHKLPSELDSLDIRLHYGLWKYCDRSICDRLTDKEEDYSKVLFLTAIKVSQAFSVIGIILTFLLLVVLSTGKYLNLKYYLYAGAVLCCLITFCIWIGIYRSKKTVSMMDLKSTPSWSYWVYFAGSIVLSTSLYFF